MERRLKESEEYLLLYVRVEMKGHSEPKGEVHGLLTNLSLR